MARFYFFTDIDLLNLQVQSGAFGPAGTSGGKDKYQVTSMHTASSDPGAYAICDGIVFVQEDSTNANLVNLVLKPLSQPPFAFPKVKFFVYRGIKKDSLINGNEIASSGANDLTESIWSSQSARNVSADTSDKPPKGALGIDLTAPAFPDTHSIEDVFYRADVTYQFPIARSGWKIGKFDASAFGLEIMTEAIGFDPVLARVREDKNIIEVDTLPGSPTQPQEFEHWHDKEEVLNYIDPCAFFGSFFKNALRVRSSVSSTVDKVSENELYDTVISTFYNKNTVYLDIRNEYNYSFNYFKNYGRDIKIAYETSGSLASRDYYASGWPILTIQNNDFPNTNTSLEKNALKISMPDGSGDNPLPMMYISSGYLDSEYPREPKGKNRMIDLAVTTGFSDEVVMATFNRAGLTNTTSVSSYIKLKYFKRFDPEATNPPVSSGTVLRAGNFMDHLFAPYSMKIPFEGTANVKTVVYDEEMFVDAKKELGADFIAKVGNSDDGANNVFFAFPDILRKEESVISEPFTFSSETDASFSDFYGLIVGKLQNKRVRKSYFELSNDVEYLELVEIETTELFKNISTGELVCIGLKKSNLLDIDISAFLNKYRIYLYFTNKVETYDELGQSITIYDVGLRGFGLNSGVIEFKEIVSTLKIYYHGSIV